MRKIISKCKENKQKAKSDPPGIGIKKENRQLLAVYSLPRLIIYEWQLMKPCISAGGVKCNYKTPEESDLFVGNCITPPFVQPVCVLISLLTTI